jgi:uncharacterized protein (TIGR03382 family)
MNRILALAAVAGIAGIAQAQNTVTFDIQVSTDGSTWGDSVAVNSYSATTVFGRLVLRGSLAGNTNIVGLPGGTLGSLPVSNTLASDATSNLAGRFASASPASNIALRGAGTAGAAIDRSSTASNITLQNLPPNSGGLGGNDVVFMTFNFDLGTSAADRTLALSVGTTSSISIYTTAGGSSSTATTIRDGASIIVTPAPGALALVGLGGLVAGRRRR